ncbi:hypothetical protein BDV33DRAFT_196211 [Aspergillus novoparasiticus]|uniref:Uncharacterized protein n=1 Tax=Aspergillus novoparasiticus TaxID=986946 RepID=A0A5N6E9P8_9EURO|nr:hypothetical protein BDV33DRAFT_196211 [Aspergillus novoparasiticus]
MASGTVTNSGICSICLDHTQNVNLSRDVCHKVPWERPSRADREGADVSPGKGLVRTHPTTSPRSTHSLAYLTDQQHAPERDG